MSDPLLHEHPVAEGVRVEAADWILKQRFQENWTEQDQRELDAWLAQSTANLLNYLRLEAAWKQTDRLAALRGSMRAEPASARWPFLTQIAAAFVLVAVAGAIGMHYFQRPQQKIFSTPVGGRERVVLADGSFIELNTDTVLRLTADGSSRIVYLDRGEAYFKIHHNAARPFAVIAGDHRVTDLGTAFSVRREPREVAVALVEGRARFDAQKNPATLELTPGDEVIATRAGISRTEKPLAELIKALSWRRGVLVFYGATLADAAAEFNRYSITKLVIADPEVAQLKINGTFQTNNVQAFADATRVVLKLKLESRNAEILISK
jgi:transmembrane sensor